MKRKNEWKTVKLVLTGGKIDVQEKPLGVRLEITDLDKEWKKIKTEVHFANKLIKDSEIIKFQ